MDRRKFIKAAPPLAFLAASASGYARDIQASQEIYLFAASLAWQPGFIIATKRIRSGNST